MESSKESTKVDYGKDKDGKPVRRLRLFPRARQLCPGREAIRLQAAAHLEALPRSSRIRFGLVLARRGAPSQRCRRAHAERGRLLRPGRYVRPAGGVRNAGAARREARELPRAGSVAARLLGSSRATWAISTTASPSATSSAPGSKRSSSRHYLKDEPGFDSRRHRQLPDRLEHLEALRAFSAQRIAAHQPLSRGRWPAQLERLNRNGNDAAYVSDPGQSRALPPPAHPAHLRRRLAVVQLAHRRPALRHRTARTWPCGSCPCSRKT